MKKLLFVLCAVSLLSACSSTKMDEMFETSEAVSDVNEVATTEVVKKETASAKIFQESEGTIAAQLEKKLEELKQQKTAEMEKALKDYRKEKLDEVNEAVEEFRTQKLEDAENTIEQYKQRQIADIENTLEDYAETALEDYRTVKMAEIADAKEVAEKTVQGVSGKISN